MEIAPELRQILAELRARLERLYGERLVGLLLYGSQARGDAEDGSDIDVMVMLEGEVNPYAEIERSGDDVAGLSLEHNVVIACFFVSREEFESQRLSVFRNARREGVAI